MLCRSGYQHLCCLQNKEIIKAVKKALNVSILKRGKFFFFFLSPCMPTAFKCGLQQLMGSFWVPT